MTKRINFKAARALKRHTSLIGVIIITTIFAITLGISSMHSISAQTPQLIDTKPQQFNLDAAYAYVGKDPQNDSVTDSRGALLSPVSEYPSAVYFNITRPIVENVQCDALLEVFTVKIASDNNLAENFAFFAGTNYNPSFSDEELNTLTKGIYNLIDVNKVDAVRGNFRFNWTHNESILSAEVGSYGIYTNYFHGLGLWSKGKPNTISVTFYRIGYVTMTNGVISVQPDTESANSKSQVQLQAYNDGFLKNDILPMDKLPQDHFKPFS